MILMLEERGLKKTKEVVCENQVDSRWEDDKGNVVILSQTFYPPDEVESDIIIVTGKLPPIKTINNKQKEEKKFHQEMAVIRFIIANIERLIKGEIIRLTDITEKPNEHPHYHSRVYTELSYEKGILVHSEYRSGSPSCWNKYSNEYSVNIFDIAHWIRSDINEAASLMYNEDYEVKFMDVEGF